MTSQQLTRLLEGAGLTRKAAAEKLEIHERTMRKFCAGEAPIPKSIEIAIKCLCLHQEKEV